MSALLEQLSAERRRRRQRSLEKRRRIIGSGGGYYYDASAIVAQVSALSSLFRVEGATITGSGASSVPDVLNGNPAVQNNNTFRPPVGTSNNGLPILNCTAHQLTLPIIAAISNTATWGFFAWIRPTTGSDSLMSFMSTSSSGANLSRSTIYGVPMQSDFYGGGIRKATAPVNALATWSLITVEYDTSAVGDLRCTRTLDTVVQSPGYTGSGGALVMPAPLVTVTGNASLFAFNPSALFPFIGSIGPNFGFFNSKMAGATSGLLTAAARTALLNFERPT